MSTSDYLLGVNQTEFNRLKFQHSVWHDNTKAFFDRIGVGKGWHCLDVGAGPGFVSFDLRERVGEKGSVTALEPSTMYLDWLGEQIKKNHWNNLHIINGTAEEEKLPKGQFDLIFSRWVIAFVADPEKFIANLLPALKPGGVIAFQDYYYEGLSLYPKGGPFDGMPEVVKKYYATVGGDSYVTGKIPGWLKKHGLKIIDFSPHSYAGGPESTIMQWAHLFFSTHIDQMVEKGAVTREQGDAMLTDWQDHRKNPETIFFSPIVVDVAGKNQ